LTEIKANLPKTRENARFIDDLFKRNDKGFYVNGKKKMTSARKAARYIGRYMARPALAEYKIIRYDGRMVTYWYIDHKTGHKITETIEAKEFIKRFASGELDQLINSEIEPVASSIDKLYEEFDLYLIHGGFLTAINDMAKHERILSPTFSTYSDWIRGDVLKRGKQEHYLREVMEAMIKRYGSQVTWNALARDLSIDHPKTVADYIALLESMDAVFIQAALVEDKLTAAPKKARKLMFTDPFIFHAVRAWLNQVNDPYTQQVTPVISDPNWAARLVKACVATHYRRYYPTYYIKAKGEVDIAYVDKNRFWPLEIKWTRQIRPKDLKQIAKYPNGRILSRSRQHGEIIRLPVEPLPLTILRLGSGKMSHYRLSDNSFHKDRRKNLSKSC
jgi:hypothetical protein